MKTVDFKDFLRTCNTESEQCLAPDVVTQSRKIFFLPACYTKSSREKAILPDYYNCIEIVQMALICISFRMEFYAYRTWAIWGCVKYHRKEKRLRREENKTDRMKHANQVKLETYVRCKFVSPRHIFWLNCTVLSTEFYPYSFRQIYPANELNCTVVPTEVYSY